MPPMSLLQDVLRQQLEVVEDAQRRLENNPASRTLLSPPDSDEDETIDVTSGAATPLRSRAVTPRSSSPTRSPPRKSIKPSPLALSSLAVPGALNSGNDQRIHADRGQADGSKRGDSRDPLRLLPDKIRPFIFCLLDARDLAACSLVCQRWKKSQTINHAWYQLYRRESYEENALPVGKWTKRESKKDWRSTYLNTRRINAKEVSPLLLYSKPRTPARSGTATPYHPDGYLTPREMKEEEWKSEQETSPSKVEKRSWYKEMGGKRVKKSKTGMSGGMGMRDRTAWGEDY